MTNGTRLALTLTGVTALATAATSTAYACDTRELAPTTTLQAATLDLRTPLNPTVYRAFLDAKLATVAAYVDALRAKVAAIPAGTVLTGAARWEAKAKLAKVAHMRALLDAIPLSGTYAATAAERARIAEIRADLDAIAARLKMLLANAPAVVTPTTVKPAVLGTTFDRHVCDHHWSGSFDRTRWGGSTWWWHH